MLVGLTADTGVIIYLMAGIGVLGIIAKGINQFTLHRLVKAAGNMPKSTHRLIKLVRAKYEHACMIHDSVENIDAFVEKYIYEYRGFLFRIHTWRQIEILSVWFAGLLAALGAALEYSSYGMNEAVYQYLAAGAAEMVLLSVIMRLSDEPYKINAIKMYMVDYLENICAFRLRRQSQRERESIDVITAENNGKDTGRNTAGEFSRDAAKGAAAEFSRESAKGALRQSPGGADKDAVGEAAREPVRESARETVRETGRTGFGLRKGKTQDNPQENLSINIEGEPRNVQKGDAARQAVRSAAESGSDEDRTALREEAIRQILEEFLA